jgi:hypothetical protein
MLTNQPNATTQLGSRGRALARARRRFNPVAVLVFLALAGIAVIYALRSGGSYDLVAYEENGLVIWWVLAIAFALGLLPRTRPSRATLIFIGALAAYAAWTALSLTWTDSSELTTAELARALDYLGLGVLLAFGLDRDTWRPAAAGLAFGALLVCVVAVGSRLDPSVFGADRLASSLHIDRLSRPFGYWNTVAAWGAMCLAIAVTWSAHDRSRIRRAVALALTPVAGLTIYLTYSRAGAAGAALALIATLLCSRNRLTALLHALAAAAGTGAVILVVRGNSEIARATGTRGATAVFVALLLAALGCAAAALLTRAIHTDHLRLPRQAVRPVAVLGAIAVLVPAAVAGPHLVSTAWHSFTKGPQVSNTVDPASRLTTLSGSRYPLWQSAIKAFDAHPVGGTGAGTLIFWWNQHATNGEFIRDAHNIWLENMAELGFPGLLLIVAVAVSAIALGIVALRRTHRPASAGAAAAFLAAFIVYLLHSTVDWTWESTAVTVLAIGGVAILAARLGRRGLRLRLPSRAVLALLATVAGIVQLPGILSTIELRRSQSAERRGNASLALGAAQNAVTAQPWSASAYEQRGLVYESVGQLQRAADDLHRAIVHEPDNYSHWLILSRIETEQGQLTAAVQAFERAHQLRPMASVFALAPYFKTR